MVKMTESAVERLEKVDAELHFILGKLKEKPKERTMTLSELNKLMEKDVLAGVDATKLIREMRNKKYDW